MFFLVNMYTGPQLFKGQGIKRIGLGTFYALDSNLVSASYPDTSKIADLQTLLYFVFWEMGKNARKATAAPRWIGKAASEYK